LRGVFLCMKYQIPLMLKHGGGAIVNTSSGAGVKGIAGQAAYCAAKFGVIGLTKATALDYAAHNIRVNAIGPGPTDTPLLSPAFSDEFVAAVRKNTPLGRLGSPELVADGIVNLLRSDWITGQAVMVDGGASLMSARGGTREFGPIAAKPGH